MEASGHSHESERIELEEFRIGRISIAGFQPRILRFSDQLDEGINGVPCVIGMDLLKATDAHFSYHNKSAYLKRSEAKN